MDLDSLLKLPVPLVTVLELDPQLADLHEGENVGDPFDHKRRGLLLLRGRLTNLHKHIH